MYELYRSDTRVDALLYRRACLRIFSDRWLDQRSCSIQLCQVKDDMVVCLLYDRTDRKSVWTARLVRRRLEEL